jgi:hypothetical protein
MELAGSFFIALILITSYAALGGNNNGNSQQQTTASPSNANNAFAAVWHATNTTSAQVIGYQSSFTVKAICNSTANQTISAVASLLNGMDKNSSVLQTQLGDQIFVESPYLNFSQVYDYIESGENATSRACTVFDAKASVSIPSYLNLRATDIYNQSIRRQTRIYVPDSMRTFTLPLSINSSYDLNRNISVQVTSLLTLNMTVYGNMSISRA